MAETRLERSGSPNGWKRRAFRAPIWLYRAHLGALMGKRFLMLEHRGRKSGKTRQTVLEVVSNQDHAVYIAAAWGSKADWLRNVRANPHVAVLLGNATFETNAVELGETRARAVLVEYGDRHPKAFDKLAHFMLEEPGESTGEQVDRVAAAIPIVELPKPV